MPSWQADDQISSSPTGGAPASGRHARSSALQGSQTMARPPQGAEHAAHSGGVRILAIAAAALIARELQRPARG